MPAHAADDEHTAVGIHGAVASAEAHASEIGLAVLKRGGNAVDAAVAVGFALSVTHPSAGNIGGGGFMVLRLPDGTTKAVDYREVAPAKATRDMYVGTDGKVGKGSRVGPLAAGIPGDVAGFGHVHAAYGSLPWRELVMPAVELARDGWTLDSFHAEDLQKGSKRMADAGYPDSAAIFRRADGSDYSAGDLWRQPELAETLQAIADGGWRTFYDGPLAEKIVRGAQGLGSIWTTRDFREYSVVERAPLEFDYRGYRIVAMPPPSAGGVVLRQVLAATEHLGLAQLPRFSGQRAHLYAEILRRTYADRNQLIGDPGFVDVPVDALLDTSYIAERMGTIDPDKATPSSEVGSGVTYRESHQTTHFSVVDQNGMAVANTYTLNGGFGAKVVVPGTGVIMNNEMDDFSAQPGTPNMYGLVQGEQNSIAPGKRMLSSMTPTIITKDGELRAIVGSPGGPTISTTVAQIIMHVLDYGATIDDAVRAPRLHHQWLPDTVLHEARVDPEVLKYLQERGHALREWSRIGHANCIEVDPQTRGFRAIADYSRDGGKAVAY